MRREPGVELFDLAVLAIVLVVASAVFFVPAPLVAAAGRDGWLSVPVAGTVALAAVPVLVRGFFAPGLDPVRRYEVLVPVRVALGLAYGGFAAYLGAVVTAETMHVLAVAMPETPHVVFAGLLAAAAWIGAAHGRRGLARAGVALFPVMLVAAIANLLLAWPGNADFGELLPLLEFGFEPVLRPVPLLLAWLGEVGLLTFLAEADGGRARRAAVYLAGAYLAIVALLTMTTVTAVAVLGPVATANSFVPTVTLARLVRVSPIFNRVETAILTAWLLGIFVKLALIVLAGAAALARGLGFEESPRARRWLVTALATAAAVGALTLFPEARMLVDHIARTWPVIGTGAFALTLLVGLLPAIGRNRRRAG